MHKFIHHWYQIRLTDMQKSNLDDIISIVVPIIFGIVFVIGLIGNSLVVAVVSSNQQVNSFYPPASSSLLATD